MKFITLQGGFVKTLVRAEHITSIQSIDVNGYQGVRIGLVSGETFVEEYDNSKEAIDRIEDLEHIIEHNCK